jgi:hypothetical protein
MRGQHGKKRAKLAAKVKEERLPVEERGRGSTMIKSLGHLFKDK